MLQLLRLVMQDFFKNHPFVYILFFEFVMLYHTYIYPFSCIPVGIVFFFLFFFASKKRKLVYRKLINLSSSPPIFFFFFRLKLNLPFLHKTNDQISIFLKICSLDSRVAKSNQAYSFVLKKLNLARVLKKRYQISTSQEKVKSNLQLQNNYTF